MRSLISSLFVAVLVLATASSVVANENGLGALPAMGWNTWCTLATCEQPGSIGLLHDFCNESEVLSVAEAMAENGMQDAGYVYINLDDCWEATTRTSNGSIQWDTSRFPNGIPALADKLHSMGFLFGLYISLGNQTCSQGMRNAPIPGSYGHYEDDAASVASWGVDYIKADWCGTKFDGMQLQYENQTDDLATAVYNTGRPMWLNFHCPLNSDPPTVPLWCAQDGNSYRIAGDHHDVWSSTSSIINTVRYLGPYAGPHHWNDNDFLMTGGAGCDDFQPGNHCPGQTFYEYRTEFSIWSIVNSQLILSTDPRNMPANMSSILLNKEVIAVNQDKLASAGMFVANLTNGVELWAKEMSGDRFAIALFNGMDTAVSNTPVQLSLVTSATVDVRDLWQQTDLGSFTGSFTYATTLEVHDTAMLLLTPSSSSA